MDEGTRQAGELDTDGGGTRSPEEIERDIAQTRAELGDTVEALAQKADVKGRARQRADELKATAREKKDAVVSTAKAQTPETAAAGAQQVAGKAKQNPLPLAVAGGVAAGFVLGRLTAR